MDAKHTMAKDTKKPQKWRVNEMKAHSSVGMVLSFAMVLSLAGAANAAELKVQADSGGEQLSRVYPGSTSDGIVYFLVTNGGTPVTDLDATAIKFKGIKAPTGSCATTMKEIYTGRSDRGVYSVTVGAPSLCGGWKAGTYLFSLQVSKQRATSLDSGSTLVTMRVQ